MIFELYGILHKNAKKVLKRNNELPPTMKMVDFKVDKFDADGYCKIDMEKNFFINDLEFAKNNLMLKKSQVYPIENLVPSRFDRNYDASFIIRKKKLKFSKSIDEASLKWDKFLSNSVIPTGYRNEGCHYAGFISECQEWCLPSWIWTNAALVRYYCLNDEKEKAKKLGDTIISQQLDCGGWIVRNDYTKAGVIPELAPNDSCYIALNCCLSLYETFNENKYLESAENCASWIIETARPDGLVHFGYDMKRSVWIEDRNIVDIGFTAGLFAKLYELTSNKKYFKFLEQFIESYIETFYIAEKKCFATAVDGNNSQKGGAFGRGQGWALEGLIPAYRVLRHSKIKIIIQETIDTLMKSQLKDGGWSYNLIKPLMGIDCKAVPVIAKCLVDWLFLEGDDPTIYNSVYKALEWCAKHTVTDGVAEGGIFSYTIEGAIVHHMYTSTAFIYGSSYAAEVNLLINEFRISKGDNR